MSEFGGRVAVVTGAGSGIGRATVHRLVDEGATVVAADVQADGLELTAKEASRPEAVTILTGDVTDPTFGTTAVAAAVDAGGRLDTLVNCAGILRFEHSHEVTRETWLKIQDVNVNGTFFTCQAAIPALLESRGAIVNIASTAGHFAHPWAVAYSASKGAVLALTRTLAVEYAKQGLRANTVSPGSIQTPITDMFDLPEGADSKLLYRIMAPVGMGDPARVAATVAFLGCDDSLHVTGTDVRIDGATHA